jgi:hypothetical protein
MDFMFEGVRASDENVIDIDINESRPRVTSSIKRWKVWAALRRPKGILVNSNKPKGVVIAGFLQSFNMLTADISSVFYNTDSCLIVVYALSAKVI